VRSLKPILEIKRTLAGVEKRFDCTRLAGDDRHVVVLWIAPEAMHVHGVDLPKGTISFGHFWSDRFYNVYHWVDPSGRTLGLYFNIADSTVIGQDRLEWRDLIVDVLATPAGTVKVLDEDELPPSVADDKMVASHLAAGLGAVMRAPDRLIADIEAASRALYPLVLPSG
jgi:hypothetical protein